MELILTIAIVALLAFWCRSIAKGNGRDKNLAVLMGILFGIIAVIVYAVIGKTDEKKKEETTKVVEEVQKQKSKKDE